MPKCDLLCNFIKITLWHGCSPVNLLRVFKTPFLKNKSGGRLLKIGLKWVHKEIRTGKPILQSKVNIESVPEIIVDLIR